MLKSPPSSSVGRRLSRVQWQSGGAEAASIEGHTQPRFKSPSQLIPITNSTPPCNLLTRPWAGLGPICGRDWFCSAMLERVITEW
ncbi:unnamed protein product [Staurois parvus]|nr:unnamed protein product [Staurois parvus]